MAVVTIMATLSIKPGHEQRVLDLQHQYVADTRREPGCLRFDMHRDVANPSRFRIYEQFSDEAALQAHRQAPHALAWRKAMAEIEQTPVEATFWDVLT